MSTQHAAAVVVTDPLLFTPSTTHPLNRLDYQLNSNLQNNKNDACIASLIFSVVPGTSVHTDLYGPRASKILRSGEYLVTEAGP